MNEWKKTITNSFTKSEFRQFIVCLSNECNSGGLCKYSSAHFMNELNHRPLYSKLFIHNDENERTEK